MNYYLVALLDAFVLILCWTSVQSADDLLIRKDGSYQYGYAGPDSYHQSQANRNNVVRGKFGGRNPKTGQLQQTISHQLKHDSCAYNRWDRPSNLHCWTKRVQASRRQRGPQVRPGPDPERSHRVPGRSIFRPQRGPELLLQIQHADLR